MNRVRFRCFDNAHEDLLKAVNSATTTLVPVFESEVSVSDKSGIWVIDAGLCAFVVMAPSAPLCCEWLTVRLGFV